MKLTKGYKNVREKVINTSRYTKECGNCRFFYQTEEDEEELCQNSNVLKYDICVEGERVYCSFWRGITPDENERRK